MTQAPFLVLQNHVGTEDTVRRKTGKCKCYLAVPNSFFVFFQKKNLKEWDFSGKLTGKRI